jgi:DNA-binding IscR family transcriptional regulator
MLAAHRGVTGGYELTALARNSSVLDVGEARQVR